MHKGIFKLVMGGEYYNIVFFFKQRSSERERNLPSADSYPKGLQD